MYMLRSVYSNAMQFYVQYLVSSGKLLRSCYNISVFVIQLVLIKLIQGKFTIETEIQLKTFIIASQNKLALY